MKKSTIEYLCAYLSDIIDMDGGEEFSAPSLVTARDELVSELKKGAEKAEKNREAYAAMKVQIFDCLRMAAAPVTAQEIADETSLSRGKIVYGLTNYWADEVVKNTTGKSTTYAIKA